MEVINVAVRIRPSLNVLEDSIGIQVISVDPPVLFVKDRQQHYTFDNISSEDVHQNEFYEQMVKPLLHKVLSGYNCTVFAYGQTGTGKTYTIGSDPETYDDAGFIIRALDEVFDSREEVEIGVSVSFFEIYNEKAYDLLTNNKTALLVKGFQVQGLTVTKVNDSLEAQELLKLGSKNRHTGETKQNQSSSRSHAIFTIHCNVKHENSETEAKLNLVDLAGSEGVRKTGCEGSQFQEGVHINKGLLHIGMVINALSTNKTHIPYRRSILTTILQDSLDKRNYITFVACISPDSQDMHETVQTLQFAQRAKKLKNKPEVNNIVQQYRKENPNLFEKQLLSSAVKSTPLKRPNYLSLQYSETKKPKVASNHSWTPMNTVAQPINKLSPTSLNSMSLSSISTISDVTPSVLPSLSPLVKPIFQKYADAFETTMMEKLQVLMNTQRRPTPDKRITSQFPWQLIQTEVTQMVQKEIIQFTGQRSRACSSPISAADISFPADQSVSDLRVVAKRLAFDEEPPCSEQRNFEEPEPSVFKIPTALPRKINKGSKRKASDEDVTLLATELFDEEPSTRAKLVPRRTTRLSLKKPATPTVKASSFKRRQSARLSVKRQNPSEPIPQSDVERDVHYPTPAPRKKVKRAAAASPATSPATSHNQYILNILNTGDQKELQKLPSIGAKTAAQICFYRQLHGQFSSIADLGKMESWRGTAYQRFLTANFLKVDDD